MKQFLNSTEEWKKYLSLFQKQEEEFPFFIDSFNIGDSIQLMKEMIYKTKSQTVKLSRTLNAYNLEVTCRKIYEFWHKNIELVPLELDINPIKSPSSLFHEAAKGGDTISLSIAISQTLLNCGISHYLRVVKLSQNSYFDHVYVIVPVKQTDLLIKENDQTSYFTLDFSAKNGFNEEEFYIMKQDFIIRLVDLVNEPKKGHPFNMLSSVFDLSKSKIHPRIA